MDNAQCRHVCHGKDCRAMADDFFDARDWEKEVEELLKIDDAERSYRHWRDEATSMRKQWECERREKVDLFSQVKVLTCRSP